MSSQGKVLKSTGKWYDVELADRSIVKCRIRGKIRLEGLRTTNPVSVGDMVNLSEVEDEEGNRVIESIEKRKNYIVRKSTNLSKQQQILAANIDRAYLMVTLKEPETHLAFIDRFLVSAQAYRIPVTLLFNKIDGYSENQKAELRKMATVYSKIGYPTHFISALAGEGIEQLKQQMRGKVSMFSGHSGVGKSTLANAIDPQLDLKTASISSSHAQGQHTTTFAEMYDLESNMRIVDTPGIRGFGVVDMAPDELSDYFPEFLARQSDCKFNNCMHTEEPHCAIKDAVAQAEIAASRYQSYLQLLEEDTPYRK